MIKQKYPELANKNEWTPKMMYIHQRAMGLGLTFGFILGVLVSIMAAVIISGFNHG
jgi:hypothetical protein